MLENSLFGLPRIAVIHYRFWDDECVIYNQLTGETHLVNGMGAELFRLISQKPVTRTQLLQSILSIFELEIDSDVEGLVDNLILEYQKLGLLAVIENTPA